MAANGFDLHLGVDLEDGEEVSLQPEHELTGIHIIGPPGIGKTNLATHLYRQCCDRRDGSVFVFSNKGDLGPTCRDMAVRDGHGSRLVLFDPGLSDAVIGYDPLKPRGSIADDACEVREGILASWNQTELTQTPQLEWLLYMAAYIARARGWTLDSITDLVRPTCPLRAEALPTIDDPAVCKLIRYLDTLSPALREKLAAPAHARLQRLTSHPLMRRILTQQKRSIDLAELMESRKIIVVNLEQYRPFGLEEVRFLGRLLLNEIVRRIFDRGPGHPRVYLIIDEAQVFASEQLCRLLEQGRELNVTLVLAHHFLEQLELEDGDRRLLAGVLQCAMTKVLTGRSWIPNYRQFMEHFFVDQWDPLAVKHQDWTLENRVRETTRTSVAVTESEDEAFSIAWPRMRATARGTSDAAGDTELDNAGSATGMVMLPDGTMIPTASDFAGGGFSQTRTHTDIQQTSTSRGRVPGMSWRRGRSTTTTTQPFHEIRQVRVPTNTKHWTLDEFLAVCTQATSRLRVGQILVKSPSSPATAVQVPLVGWERLGREALGRTHLRVLSQSCYTPLATIEAEENAARQSAPPPAPRRPRRPRAGS